MHNRKILILGHPGVAAIFLHNLSHQCLSALPGAVYVIEDNQRQACTVTYLSQKAALSPVFATSTVGVNLCIVLNTPSTVFDDHLTKAKQQIENKKIPILQLDDFTVSSITNVWEQISRFMPPAEPTHLLDDSTETAQTQLPTNIVPAGKLKKSKAKFFKDRMDYQSSKPKALYSPQEREWVRNSRSVRESTRIGGRVFAFR